MKKIILAAAALVVATSVPALAKTHSHPAAHRGQAAAASAQTILPPNVLYSQGGRYLGTDPDPTVRTQLLRDGDAVEGF